MIYTIAAAAFAAVTHLPWNPQFEAWKRTHEKAYATFEEELEALKAFESNEMIIREHNAKNLSWTLGHNAYSDLTWEQFKNKHMSELFLNRNPKNARRAFIQQSGIKMADAKDWVSMGAVTPVKDQVRRPRIGVQSLSSSRTRVLLSSPCCCCPLVLSPDFARFRRPAAARAGPSRPRARSRARTRSRRAASSRFQSSSWCRATTMATRAATAA